MPRLLMLPVEYRVCPACGHDYAGDRCDRWADDPHAHAAAPEATRHEQERLLVVEAEPPLYERVERRNCTEHKLLYLPTDAHCPRCVAPPDRAARAKWIWKATGLQVISSDAQPGGGAADESDVDIDVDVDIDADPDGASDDDDMEYRP